MDEIYEESIRQMKNSESNYCYMTPKSYFDDEHNKLFDHWLTRLNQYYLEQHGHLGIHS